MEQVTWTTLTSGKLSFRYKSKGYLFDGTGSSVFTDDHEKLLYCLGLLNSKVGEYLIGIIGQTMSYEVGMISKIPIIYNPSQDLLEHIRKCIELCEQDWNDYSVSWDFKSHPLIKESKLIEEAINIWNENKSKRNTDISTRRNF